MTAERRWGRVTWWVVWAGLTAAQVAALVTLGAATAGAWAAVLAVQLLKVAASLPRLADLGRPPDDALWGLVPLGNVVLWGWLAAATPPEDVRARRTRAWTRRLGVFAAWRRGLASALATGATGAVGLVLVGVAQPLLGERALRLARDTLSAARATPASAAPSELASSVGDLLGLTTAVLGAYLVFQLLRRKRASRASWWPTLFLPPVALAALTLDLAPTLGGDMGIVLLMLVSIAWQITAGLVFGAPATLVWILGALAKARGGPSGVGEILGAVPRHLGGFVVVYGARLLAVLVGLQVLYVPGIWYATTWAFADTLVVYDPERPALRGAAFLARGIRGHLLKILAVWVLLGFGPSILLFALTVPVEQLQAMMVDPSVWTTQQTLIEGLNVALASWIASHAFVHAFLDREALREEVEAQRAAREADDAGAPAS